MERSLFPGLSAPASQLSLPGLVVLLPGLCVIAMCPQQALGTEPHKEEQA